MSSDAVAKITEKPEISIRPATEADLDLILWFIHQLAIFEKAPDQVTATPDLLRQNLFGPHPYAHVLLVHAKTADKMEPAGFALYFHNFSTWLGRPGLYLEDLFVCPEYRNMGVGKLLLSRLAGIAREKGCGRMEWTVLDWNQPAIDFYEGVGARLLKEWIICRVDGKSLQEFIRM
ncbi:acetyltransferase [Coemansia erecta]|uniref:Acetyltransferase n=1 Tax=Coemansia asiatica TaxID=1052880 RepID=A0A9W7XLM5_9FUNG|nr:acetyltransferase [Coemansia asiatica]KAJ2848087.1 acetyltransferase [Coemansia erecta]KAJ2856996.1 acetyltransferase [Coemansia asiatica]